ncbi:hypothetical protein G6L15_08505 [Agrobacterium rhizogenes]|uniref:HNH endonuclease n=1 Tax=Rhizobium rhizogenes TaxID=359 RepID=UPI001573C079|nr:HNH endonuclease [Rhizobium rhizogenes]NTG86185.1 hypothetical protein [Rhizobium rhizogenes]
MTNAPLPIEISESNLSLRARFEAKMMPEPNSGCWLWLGGLDAGGYARFQVGRASRKASRVALVLYRATDVGGAQVLHRCDNPACVNPAHLYVGTALQNAQDRMIRGRKGDIAGAKNPNCGSKNHTSKLSDVKVREIRGLLGKIGYKRLAKRYGVSPSSIQGIANGKRWGWLK